MLKMAYQIGVELAFKEAGLDPKLAGIMSTIGKGVGKLFGKGKSVAKPGSFGAFQKSKKAKKLLGGADATATSTYRKTMGGTSAGGRRRAPQAA